MTQLATIEELTPDALEAVLPELAGVLHASVHAGASIGFVLPFSPTEAAAFWRGVLPAMRSGERLMLVARLDGRIVGTAALVLVMTPNGRHRAEVAKVMVHPEARRRGIAARLMQAVEAAARRHGRTLLLLDTTTGRDAERLYTALGYATIGTVAAYANDPDGTLHPTTIMAKDLADA
jgi:GNAT superfamily N-acetyltransferase